ncbi:hypothetical protein ANAPH2_00463 [Anaplasma phagocytophilum]|nr:hypothetical protein ANAPH2_00463 [Anaplasma phagocytophilum]
MTDAYGALNALQVQAAFQFLEMFVIRVHL